jgi:hypothetical protein
MPIDFSQPIEEWLPTMTYPGYQAGLPDLVLGRFPPELVASSRRRFKSWIVETPAEMKALTEALARPVPQLRPGALDFKSGPDKAVTRRSSGQPFCALYVPPAPGWPWVVLSAWPAALAHQVGAERGRYTWDSFDTEAAAIELMARIRIALGGGKIIVPDPTKLH